LEKPKLFKQINQIGIVTNDIEKILKHYEDFLGVGPFLVLDRKDQTAIYNGKEIKFSTKTATAPFGSIQIEINHIYEGETPHTDWIKRNGEGFQHFGIFVDDIEESKKEMEKKGIKCFFEGIVKGIGIKFAYLDTESIFGYIYEFIELPKRKKSKKTQ